MAKTESKAQRKVAVSSRRLVRFDVLDPVRVGGPIVERLIRVIGETRVIERTFYEFDRTCDWQRKRREVLIPIKRDYEAS